MGGSLTRMLSCSIGVATFVLVNLTVMGGARAQDCERLSGPARTDCDVGRARIFGTQSDIAAGQARVRASAERLRAVTGGTYDPAQRKTKARHKVRRNH